MKAKIKPVDASSEEAKERNRMDVLETTCDVVNTVTSTIAGATAGGMLFMAGKIALDAMLDKLCPDAGLDESEKKTKNFTKTLYTAGIGIGSIGAGVAIGQKIYDANDVDYQVDKRIACKNLAESNYGKTTIVIPVKLGRRNGNKNGSFKTPIFFYYILFPFPIRFNSRAVFLKSCFF